MYANFGIVAIGLAMGAGIGLLATQPTLIPELPRIAEPMAFAETPGVSCVSPRITDGDTFRCGSEKVRLAHIDAPEMPGHCRPGRACTPGDPYAAQAYLERISRGRVVCRQVDRDHYGRMVALCAAHDRDLSCEMVAAGHAVERYGRLAC